MRSFYKHGSEGRVNLFFRPKSLDYYVAVESQLYPARSEASHWIIQWEGNPGYDSGYQESKFSNYAEAISLFNEMEQEEYPDRIF